MSYYICSYPVFVLVQLDHLTNIAKYYWSRVEQDPTMPKLISSHEGGQLSHTFLSAQSSHSYNFSKATNNELKIKYTLVIALFVIDQEALPSPTLHIFAVVAFTSPKRNSRLRRLARIRSNTVATLPWIMNGASCFPVWCQSTWNFYGLHPRGPSGSSGRVRNVPLGSRKCYLQMCW